MSDSKQPEGGKPADPKTPADPARPRGATPAPGMTFTNQLFIWTLVILVGVIFGVGPSVADAFHQRRAQVAGYGVDESEAVRRMQAAQRLQRIIDPTGRERRFAVGDLNDHARRILIERYADRLGLKPSGKVLDRLVDDFLAKPLPGGRSGTYQSAINEFRKNREGDVTVPELERYLGEEFAVNAVFARNVHVPPVPLAIAGQMARIGRPMYGQWMGGDKVEIEQATLSARGFLKLDAIDDKDPELQRAFDELRNNPDKTVASRFEKPAVALVTVAAVDAAALVDQQQPTEAEVQAWYDAHKDEFREPAKPEDKPAEPKPGEIPKPPEPTYKPLPVVRDEILPKLKREMAARRASELVEAFVASDEAEALESEDVAAFRAAVEKAGLKVTDVPVTEPRAGVSELVLPGIGKLKQGERELGLFTRQPGFVSGAAEVAPDGDRPGTCVILRLDERRDRQPRELTEPDVLAEVKRRVAGRLAYVHFLAAAEKLRAEAEAKGPGGLRALLESDEGKAAWPDAKIEARTVRALEEVQPPPKDVGGLGDPPKPLLAYAMPNAPVALAQAPSQDDVPTVRALQVKSYQPASPNEGAARQQVAELYRGGIEYYAQREFSNELQHRIFE